ncbi:MAG: hypothetical protein MN733_31480, partial [Nitrososphaera sp.]|nr:hypothetical protein [Nitrososphaera sp.]
AQGSWGSSKGRRVEQVVKNIIRRRLREKKWVFTVSTNMVLSLIFLDEVVKLRNVDVSSTA